METHLLNSILKIRPGESQILKSTNNGPVERSIRRGRALESRNLGLRVNRSSDRMTIEHTGALKQLMRILLLMKKEAVGSPNNLDAKEVMESTQILDGKLVTQPVSDLLKKSCGGGRQDDVVDV
jgi:hypothetical protein